MAKEKITYNLKVESKCNMSDYQLYGEGKGYILSEGVK
jgi:hypothetical protein